MQVKGFMPQGSGISRECPPAEPLGEMWFGITFSIAKSLLCYKYAFVYSALFSECNFIGFCEWIDFAFFSIVYCQKGGAIYDGHGLFSTTL